MKSRITKVLSLITLVAVLCISFAGCSSLTSGDGTTTSGGSSAHCHGWIHGTHLRYALFLYDTP